MKQIIHFWHILLIGPFLWLFYNPFLWLFYYFVQPSKFYERVETNRVSQRVVTMARLALPIFLISYYPFMASNVLAALLGIAMGILLGIAIGIKWGIAGCFGFGIGLAGFPFTPSAFPPLSALLVSSICMNLSPGLSIGIAIYGDILGPASKRFLAGAIRGIIRIGSEFLTELFKWAWRGALGGIGGCLLTLVIGIVVNGITEDATRGGIIGMVIGSILGFIRGVFLARSHSESIVKSINYVLFFSIIFGLIGVLSGAVTWHILGEKEGIMALGQRWFEYLFTDLRSPPPQWVKEWFTGVNSLNDVLSVVTGIEVGVVLGIADTLLAGQVISRIKNDVRSGRERGLKGGLEEGSTLSVGWCIFVALASTLTATLTRSEMGSAVSYILGAGIYFLFFYLVTYYRLPVYGVSSLFQFITWWRSQRNPAKVFSYLNRSPLYLNEAVLRLPALTSILLIALNQDAEQTLKEITFITEKRAPQKKLRKGRS